MSSENQEPTLPATDTSADPNRLRTVYALIWRSHATDDQFDQQEFTNRIPRLMEWLRELHSQGHLLACGGGGFEHHNGGLTLIQASSPEEAMALSAGSPMNEIGSTELLVWDVFYADLLDRKNEERLKMYGKPS